MIIHSDGQSFLCLIQNIFSSLVWICGALKVEIVLANLEVHGFVLTKTIIFNKTKIILLLKLTIETQYASI